jgi:hypothetical protein
MNDKSHVSMGQHKCPVCCKDYGSGEILLDRRLRNSLERHTVTGWGDLCPDCMKLHEDGYVALIACDDELSDKTSDGNVKFDGAYRTGNVAHLKREAAGRMFNVDISDHKFVFVQDEVIDMLKEMQG